MEITKELIEAHKLTPEAVKALSDFGKDVIATEKGAIETIWKEKANKDAEGILTGAAAPVEAATGIKRTEGEKIADYLKRAGGEFLKSKQSELDTLKSDYEEKIKGVKDAGTLKAEYEKMKAEKDDILKKYADYDELKEKATKADEYGQQLSGLKLEVAFNGVKPSFPETANKYEVAAKWDEFKKEILSKYDIELVDGVPTAIDKENKYKTVKLSDLVEKNEDLSKLKEGRKQDGPNAKQVKMGKIDGVPFDVPENATTGEISKLVTDYLITTEKLDKLSDAYAKRFAELYGKIKQKTAA